MSSQRSSTIFRLIYTYTDVFDHSPSLPTAPPSASWSGTPLTQFVVSACARSGHSFHGLTVHAIFTIYRPIQLEIPVAPIENVREACHCSPIQTTHTKHATALLPSCCQPNNSPLVAPFRLHDVRSVWVESWAGVIYEFNPCWLELVVV